MIIYMIIYGCIFLYKTYIRFHTYTLTINHGYMS